MQESLSFSPRENETLKRIFEIVAEGPFHPERPGSLGHLLGRNAVEFPDRTALLFEERRIVYGELDRMANRVANAFLSRGANRGEVCALFMENGVECVAALCGLSKIGVIASLINVSLRKKALVHVIRTSTPGYVLVKDNLLEAIGEVSGELDIPMDRILVWSEKEQASHNYRDFNSIYREALTVNPSAGQTRMGDHIINIFTSGTTGLPKAAIGKSMGFINAGALLLDAIARCRPEDTVYSVLPLQHAMGINLLAGCLWLGATLALRRKFSAVAFLDDIRKFNASVAGYIGEIPRYVYNMPEKSDDTSHPLEKMVGIGFGHDLWEKFKQRFGVKEIYELYGASEGITPIANVDQRPGMLGRIYDESAARLVRYDLENDEFLKDENGTLVKCAVPGEVGMYITTAGTETGFTGYTDRGETESKILKNAFTPGDRWFISGDLMKLHGGRWVSFVDRRGDTFRWKGENVSTREVEDILGEFPAVEIVAVYGVQVPGMPGQAGMAAVIKRQDREWDWKIFSDLAGNNLPPWAVPRFIRFIESFEMTHTMKIVKVTLRKQGFDPALVGGGLFFWDVDAGMYEPMDIEIHRKILAGTIKI